MKSIGDRLGKQEKAKWGNFWDWIKSKMRDIYIFYIGGCKVVKSKINMITIKMRDSFSCFGGRLCPEGSGKGTLSCNPKACYLRCKRTTDRLSKGKE